MTKPKRIARIRRTSAPLSLKPLHKALSIIEKAAIGLFRWATTDHSGLSQALRDMPPMGFVDSLKYILCHVLLLLVSATVLWISMAVLIGYILPFVLVGVLTW